MAQFVKISFAQHDDLSSVPKPIVDRRNPFQKRILWPAQGPHVHIHTHTNYKFKTPEEFKF